VDRRPVRAASATNHSDPRRSRDAHPHRQRPPYRDPQSRTTHSGKTVATVSVASDRRDRTGGAIYVDLIVWEGQAAAAAQHLVKGQAVSFSGRFECRDYVTQAGDQHVALELHGVDLEYGAKPRSAAETVRISEPSPAAGAADDEDIPF
jgi:single-stranded DNA-binding protein